MMKVRTYILAMAVASFCARPAESTTLVRMSLDQLARAATAVVRARVVSQEARWNPEHTRIFTYTTLSVSEKLKGATAGTVVIQQPGGRVGNIHVFVPGTARFLPEAEYVLFLEPAGQTSDRYVMVGMMQGAYRVYRDGATQQERVILPLGELTHQAEDGRMAAVGGPSAPFVEFRREVATAAAAPVRIPRGTLLSVAIESTEFAGAGTLRVEARTLGEVFPSPSLIIPAGGRISGMARRTGETWTIHWDEISIRGQSVPLSAQSEAMAVGVLRGRTLVVSVR